MSRFYYPLALLLLFSAFSFSSAFAFDAFDVEASGLNMGIGYRSDQLDWNISGDADDENQIILSELSWEDLHIVQLRATGWLEVGGVPLLDGNSLVIVDLLMMLLFQLQNIFV